MFKKKKKKCFSEPLSNVLSYPKLIQKSQPPLILLHGLDSLALEALMLISVLPMLMSKQPLLWQKNNPQCLWSLMLSAESWQQCFANALPDWVTYSTTSRYNCWFALGIENILQSCFHVKRKHSTVVQSMSVRARLLGFKSHHCHLLAAWSWRTFSYPEHRKIGLIIPPTS